MGNRRGWPITRGSAAGLGVLGGLGGLGLGLVLGFFAVWFGAAAAAYPWPGDAAAARLLGWAAFLCLGAGVLDLIGALAAWRGPGPWPAGPFLLASGAFAVAAALSLWAWATATHGGMYGLFGIVCVLLALVTPCWGRWSPL
jgi:hypothetical protein